MTGGDTLPSSGPPLTGRVLIVAGSDSGGGAGIQADIKAVTALRGFATTAITALTAQNTLGVHGVVGIEPAFIAQQMRVVLDDIGTDAVKTGMLHSVPVIAAVAGVLDTLDPVVPVVIDPVMVAKGGDRLLDRGAETALIEHLLPRAHLVTPNLPEAAVLGGLEITGLEGMRRAGAAIRALGARAVLVKGGHASGETVRDLLMDESGELLLESPRQHTRHTHGTGCTLASAIATGLAQGMTMPDAVARARRYVQEAIHLAPGFGAGHGPMDHGHTARRFD